MNISSSERKFESASKIALATIKSLEDLINNSEWNTAKELMDIVRSEGKQMILNDTSHAVVGNTVKQVLKIVRDEYISALENHEEGDVQASLQSMFVAESMIDYAKPISSLKESILDNLRELQTETETSIDNIAAQSLDHIHSGEVIMTAGASKTVELFLKKAAAKRKFQVIVAEGAPFYHGHTLAKNLAQNGIETTLIHDCAIFAIMSRVNKVIIGTYSMMANGGLKASCGIHTLALAAKHQSVPLIVCAPMFKLTPQYLCSADEEGFNHLKSPHDVLPFSGDVISGVQVLNPAYDYVPPELVTLFVSNIGGNSPSYVYRLLTELYHPEDYEL